MGFFWKVNVNTVTELHKRARYVLYAYGFCWGEWFIGVMVRRKHGGEA